jgi:hypothetical protein
MKLRGLGFVSQKMKGSREEGLPRQGPHASQEDHGFGNGWSLGLASQPGGNQAVVRFECVVVRNSSGKEVEA